MADTVPEQKAAPLPHEALEAAWLAWRPGAPATRWHEFLPGPGQTVSPEAVFLLLQLDLEFRAKAGGAAQGACEAPVQAIENGRDQDGDRRDFVKTLDREANRGEAHAEGQESHKVWDDEAHRHRPKPAPPAGPAARIALKGARRAFIRPSFEAQFRVAGSMIEMRIFHAQA